MNAHLSKQSIERLIILVLMPKKGVLFEVERILDKKRLNNGLVLYQVKWKGYPIEESTWEQAKSLTNVRDMLK